MKKYIAVLVVLALWLTAVWVGSLPPSSVNAVSYYQYSIGSIAIDAPTYTSDPGSTTVDATITLTLNYVGEISSAQTFSGTVSLIRDNSVVDYENVSIAAPDTAVTSTTREATVSLSTGGSTISYLKIKVELKDSITGAVKTAEKLLYSSSAGYTITSLDPTSVKVPYGGIVQGSVKDYLGNPAEGTATLIYGPTGVSVATAAITSGMFAMAVNLTDEGNYYLTAGLAVKKIKARYNFQLLQPTTSVNSGDAVVIAGEFTDASGNPVSGEDVCLYNADGDYVESLGTTTDTGKFASVWDTHYDVPGVYYIGICGDDHGHDYGSITLQGKTFSMLSSLSEVYAGLPRTQLITFTVKNGDTLVANAPIYYTIKNNSTVIANNVSVSTDPTGEFVVTLPVDLNVGNLYVYVKAETSDGVWGEASLTLPVVVPDKIGFQLSGLENPLHVADYTVTVEALSNITPPATIDNIKVKVTGPVDTTLGSDNEGIISNGDNFTLKVLGYGTVKITLTATDSESHVVTKTFSYSVDAYRVSINQTEFTVGDKAQIVVEVKEPDGTPVNNAVVRLLSDESDVFDTGSGITDILELNGTTQNIVGGRYVFTATLLKASTIDVMVYKSDASTLMYRGYDVIKINPLMDLQMTISPTQILAGFTTNVSVAVRKNGVGIDAYVKLIDTEDGSVIETKYVSSSSPTTTFSVLMEVGEKYEIYALTTDGSHGARAYITAKGLKGVVSPTDGKITAGESESITATVFNPFSNAPIAVDTLEIVGDNVEFMNTTGANPVSSSSHISYAFTASIVNTASPAFILVRAINEGKVIYEKSFKVLPPTLKVSPLSGYVGVNNQFNISLKDAHGKPMAGRTVKVYQSGSIVGSVVTDENGEATFSFVAQSTGVLVFKYGLYAVAKASINVDITPPTILSISPTTGYTSTTDKVDVVVVVKDKETFVKDVIIRNMYTGATYYGIITKKTGTVTARFVLRLEEGQNSFIVQAVDGAGNTSDPYVYVLKYEKPVDSEPPQIVSISPASGSTLTEPVAKVRMEIRDNEMLDAVYVDFEAVKTDINAKNAIVAFTLNLKEGKNEFEIIVKDKAGNITRLNYILYYVNKTVTIELRIGSQFYKVNGKTKIMDAAPFIDPRYGRTMVPLRFIAEALGLNVGWNGESRVVTISGELAGQNKTIEIPMAGLKKVSITVNGMKVDVYESTGIVYVDGIKVNIAAMGLGKPMIYQNRTFVPIRFITELFGCSVEWMPPDTIKITYEP